MDLNSFFLNAINREAIKVALMPAIKTAFLAMALCQKLPRSSYKSNVNNISHCQACFLKLIEIFMAENFLSFSSALL